MREILFRGKRLDNEEWVYGDLYHRKTSCGVLLIIHNNGYIGDSVNPVTIGQYTGVIDKNGKQVYEDDIIGYTDVYTGKEKVFGVVKWYPEGNFYINTDSYCGYTSDNDCANVGFMLNRSTTKLHVIGNIHDNPEILKEV